MFNKLNGYLYFSLTRRITNLLLTNPQGILKISPNIFTEVGWNLLVAAVCTILILRKILQEFLCQSHIERKALKSYAEFHCSHIPFFTKTMCIKPRLRYEFSYQ
jgi:hypothetical protein